MLYCSICKICFKLHLLAYLKKPRVNCAKATHNFSAKILAHMPYLMITVLTIC